VTGHQVITPGPADTSVLAQVIAEAFHDLPPSRWLVADPAQRARIFPPYFALLVEHAMAAGTVHTTPGRDAAALWLPVAAEGLAQPGGDYSGQLAQITGRAVARFVAFDTLLDQHHPTGTPHHHLAILAVRPDAQGQGIGTALLRAHHAALGHAGTPAYLEASSPRSHSFYLRHGYTGHGEPFYLPEGGPPMWPLWRPGIQVPPARAGSG
jgi:GNAT superfamily N-acetyltransferase